MFGEFVDFSPCWSLDQVDQIILDRPHYLHHYHLNVRKSSVSTRVDVGDEVDLDQSHRTEDELENEVERLKQTITQMNEEFYLQRKDLEDHCCEQLRDLNEKAEKTHRLQQDLEKGSSLFFSLFVRDSIDDSCRIFAVAQRLRKPSIGTSNSPGRIHSRRVGKFWNPLLLRSTAGWRGEQTRSVRSDVQGEVRWSSLGRHSAADSRRRRLIVWSITGVFCFGILSFSVASFLFRWWKTDDGLIEDTHADGLEIEFELAFAFTEISSTLLSFGPMAEGRRTRKHVFPPQIKRQYIK